MHREFLRHTLATLAYRAAKPLNGAPECFENFRAAEGTRSAGEILAHLCDLMDWSLSIVRGKETWRDTEISSWEEGSRRFYEALETLDAVLAGAESLPFPLERLFQGPVADALTHVGQIALLRRLAGAPVRGENYFRADIAPGRVTTRQNPPLREFD
jgi:hypothetical protein